MTMNEPEPEMGNEWTAPSMMMGPVKMVAFYDDHDHGPACLMARATAWLSHPANEDWAMVDLKYDPFARMVEGMIQAAVVVYVQDRQNEIKPIAVLDEPFFDEHLRLAAKMDQVREGPVSSLPEPIRKMMEEQGAFVMNIDPSAMLGTREEVVAKLREQGVPEVIIEMMLPDDGGS